VTDTNYDQIARLADALSGEEKLRLVEHLARSVRLEASARPQSLRGAWRDYFPEDFDVEAALQEIRHAWESDG
jgi:hypothetical protein